MRFFRVIAGVTVTIALSWAPISSAQEQDDESERSDTLSEPETEAVTEIPEELFEYRVMDEIVVVAGPQGQSLFELQLEREERMRQVVFDEMRLREREAEETSWRQADVDLQQADSRIKWGYSPQAEQRMRRENDFMQDLPTDQVKPATLFRAEF